MSSTTNREFFYEMIAFVLYGLVFGLLIVAGIKLSQVLWAPKLNPEMNEQKQMLNEMHERESFARGMVAFRKLDRVYGNN